MKTREDWIKLRAEVSFGEWDDFLTVLVAAAAQRTNVTKTEKANALQPGDVIFLSRTCKPRMLAEAPVIYRGREGTKLRVELTNTYSAKWRKGAIIRIPHGLVGEVAPRT